MRKAVWIAVGFLISAALTPAAVAQTYQWKVKSSVSDVYVRSNLLRMDARRPRVEGVRRPLQPAALRSTLRGRERLVRAARAEPPT